MLIRVTIARLLVLLDRLFGRCQSLRRNYIWINDPNISVANDTWIHPTAIIDLIPAGVPHLGKVTIKSGVRLDRGVILAPYGGHITIKENVYIGPYTTIYGQGGVTIKKKTAIAGHCFIVAGNHTCDLSELPVIDQPSENNPILIGEGCWIGAGVNILAKVEIGDGAVIGAGAVVTKCIPSFSIAVGCPAKVLKSRGRT